MSDLPEVPIPLEEKGPFSIQRTLGRIESALVNMANDIHEAVAAQKAINERIDADEKRLADIETWRESVNTRNTILGRMVLLFLIPALMWGWSTGSYVMRLVYQYEAQQGVKK
jgi:hypothetical protein